MANPPSPLSEQEEFEFRLRAEAEAGLSAAPPKENASGANAPRTYTDMSGVTRTDAGGKPEPEERGPVGDALAYAGAIPHGIAQGAEGIANVASDPIGAVKGAVNSPKLYDAVMHPVDAISGAVSALPNVTPEQAGTATGSSIVGGAAGKALGVLGDVAGPSVKALRQKIPNVPVIGEKPVSQTVRDLANKGVVTTPGQRGGKLASAVEQKLESLAGGQSITNRRGESVVKWSSEKLDDALKTIGRPPVPANKTGRDALFHTKVELQKGYSQLLPKLSGDLNSAAPGAQPLSADIAQIRSQALQKGTGIRPTDRARLVRVIDHDVLDRFQNGNVNGKTLKEIDDVLDKEIKLYKSGNVSQRKVAEHLGEVKAKMWDMIRRENPKYAADLKKLDTGWAKFRTAGLASRIGGKGQEGAFTPNQYLRAVERKDKTKDRGKFETGQAPGQKEAESASKVLGNTVPDSGTPGRQQLIEFLKNPFASIGGIALNAVTPIAYSKPVQKWLQNRALKKGGPYKPISGRKAGAAGALAQPGSVDQNGVGQ